MRRFLPGYGWAGMGYTPTVGIPAGSMPTAPTMTAAPMAKTTITSQVVPYSPDFASFPVGSGTSPRGSTSLPGGPLRMPPREGTTTPTPSGTSADAAPSGDVAQYSGGGSTSPDGTTTIISPLPPVAGPSLMDYTHDWRVGLALVGGGALAWFFGKRILGGIAIAGGVFVVSRARLWSL